MDEPINTLTGTLEHFNGLDWVIVAAVSVSLLVGIMRGFAREAYRYSVGLVHLSVPMCLLSPSLSPSLRSATVRHSGI